ncbi:MAG: hypothetical protein NTY98_02775 [Verrucomicrobia bacterium]|nr:hypothetical protein [Verrucomicrobiota bacterium]
MRASEDKKPEPKLDAYAESADEQRKLEEQKRRMDLKNTPRDLQSQTTPERASEIRYASQEFPKTPRMPKTPSELGLEPNNTPPSAPASGPFKREHSMENLKSSGGAEGAVAMPEQKPLEAPFDIYWDKDFKGLGKKLKWPGE